MSLTEYSTEKVSKQADIDDLNPQSRSMKQGGSPGKPGKSSHDDAHAMMNPKRARTRRQTGRKRRVTLQRKA